MKHNIKDITGMKFGKLTVLRFSGKSSPNRGRIWVCQCDCGNIREVPTGRLTAKVGHIRSCKICAKKVLSRIGKQTVSNNISRRREKLHSVWGMMKQRCNNPNNGHYQWYGARGIRVCQEWENSYQAFKDWAFSHGYHEGLTIERIDVDGNYDPDNCKWITMIEQNYNKRGTRYIEYDGKKIPVAKFVYDLGLSYNPIMHYLRTYKD